MKKLSLCALFLSSLITTSVFAAQVETDVDLSSLVPADEITSAANPADMTDFDWHHPGYFKCFAKTRHGQVFHAYGRFPHEVQEQALHECYEHGFHSCYSAGCHREQIAEE